MSADDPNAPVTVSITIEPDDLKALRRFLANSPAQRRLRTMRRVFLLAVIVCVMAMLTFRHLAPWQFAAIAMAYVAFLVVGSRTLAAAQFKVCRSSFEGTVTADTDGLTLLRTHTSMHCTWSAFEETMFTPSHVLLRFNGASGIVVPARCFANSDERNRFVECATRAEAGTSLSSAPPFA